MRYFVKDEERNGSCYYEYYKGKWDGKTFWRKDSISIHDDVLYEFPEYEDAIIKVIPTYNPFGETEVYPEQWKAIGEIIKDAQARVLYMEADVWVRKTFNEYPCFTILGL